MFLVQTPHLYILLLAQNRHNIIQSGIPFFQISKLEQNFCKNSFSPSALIEWSELDGLIMSAETHLMFKKRLLTLIKLKWDKTFGLHLPTGLNLK